MRRLDVSKARVLVVGDVMLDRYWFGDVARISPEAPVPVVSVRGDVQVRRGAEESWRPLAVGDVVKPEDSMLSGKRASAVLNVGGTRLTLPEMVIVD